MTLALFLATPSLAEPADARFVIDELDVHIVVRDDNSYLVTKTYDVTFTNHNSVISKHLPYRKRGKRGSRENPVEIREISADGRRFEIIRSYPQSIRIPIQDAYRGKKERIKLSYVYDVGDDGQGMNVLNYTLIGKIQGCERVDKLTFTIEMPHHFDKDRLSFKIKKQYSSDITNIAEWQVDGTVITGRLKRQIVWPEDVDVTLSLPKGYFTTAAGRVHAEPYVLPGYIVGLAAFISYLLWRIFGRVKRIPVIASIFPPKGLTPVDVGYIMNGRFDYKKEIISLILYWAENGYLYISEVIGKKELQLHKVHNPDADADLDESSRLVDMFSSENFVQAANSIRYMNTIYSMPINSYENYIFQWIKEILPKLLLVGAPSFVCLWGHLYNYYNILEGRDESEAVLRATYIVFTCVIPFLLMFYERKDSNDRKLAFYMIVVIAFPFFLFGFEHGSFKSLKTALLRVLEIADLLLPLYLMTKCTVKMRTKTEREHIARLEGFKNYLESDNMCGPTGSQEYFYHVLPYAMVLGMTDALVKKFEHVALYPPKWYKSSSPEKTITASSFVSRLLEGL